MGRKGPNCGKLFVLLCASLIPFGSHYLKHSLGPLKTYLVDDSPEKTVENLIVANVSKGVASSPQKRFTHAEFGAFLGAVSWPNLVLPFLAGMVVDEKGHEFSALLFTSLALLGHVIFCLFLTPPLLSFLPALMGRIIYGFGEGGTGIVQGAIIGTWFEGDTVAFSIGFTESVHYFANWLGKALPVGVAMHFGGPMGALWFGTLFLFISVVVAIIYLLYSSGKPSTTFVFALDRAGQAESDFGSNRSNYSRESDSLVEPQRSGAHKVFERKRSSSLVSWYGAVVLPPERSPARESREVDEDDDDEKHPIHYYLDVQRERVRLLPLSFWLVGTMHFLFSNLHNLFGGFAVDFLHEEINLDTFTAGLIASIDSLLPIFAAPFVGMLVDKYGGRLTICTVASLMSMVAFFIFLQPELNKWSAILGMVLLSVSTSTTPTLVKSAVPVVVPTDALGTAFGVYSMFESLGGGLGHIAFGIVRDNSTSYREDILVLFLLAGVSLVVNVMTFMRAPLLNAPSMR